MEDSHVHLAFPPHKAREHEGQVVADLGGPGAGRLSRERGVGEAEQGLGCEVARGSGAKLGEGGPLGQGARHYGRGGPERSTWAGAAAAHRRRARSATGPR